MSKIGFSLQNSYAAPMKDVLRLLREIGFHAVSPVWSSSTDLDLILNTAVQQGLILQSLHGPLRGIPDLWSRDSSRSAPLLQDFLAATDVCVRYGIPVLVVHSWTGLGYTFLESELFFDNFDALVSYAQANGVRIAIENLEGPEYLSALMARYRENPFVGFCWDSGHERCYTPSKDYPAEYGDRLIMTHLNDNLGITAPDGRLQGIDDLHLLPGDGSADWSAIVRQLKQAAPQEILNFELKIRPKGDRCPLDLYSKLSVEEYLTAAYQSAVRIAEAYSA